MIFPRFLLGLQAAEHVSCRKTLLFLGDSASFLFVFFFFFFFFFFFYLFPFILVSLSPFL